jgi:hypothetical protein
MTADTTLRGLLAGAAGAGAAVAGGLAGPREALAADTGVTPHLG